MNEAFLTGSRAYGTIKPDSDIDIVIRCNPKFVQELRSFGATSGVKADEAEYLEAMGSVSLRIGPINFLCCLTDEHWMAWKLGTDELLKRTHPITREEARQVLEPLRQRFARGGPLGDAPNESK